MIDENVHNGIMDDSVKHKIYHLQWKKFPILPIIGTKINIFIDIEIKMS